MKEVCEFRINNTFIELLPKTIIGINIGPVTKIKIEKNGSEFHVVKKIVESLKENENESFFYGWGIKRSYSKKELTNAQLFQVIISNIFEPTGEECGSVYDESMACEICGANRRLVSPLILKKGTIPRKDIAKTIGGEVIASEKLLDAIRLRNLKGLQLSPINIQHYYHLNSNCEIELSTNTIVGVDPFDLSTRNNLEIYKCPKGHTLGLNILSEAFVLNNRTFGEGDFWVSRQKIGVNRGFLRPESIYFCSPAFREMVIEEKLSGFDFEIAHIQ